METTGKMVRSNRGPGCSGGHRSTSVMHFVLVAVLVTIISARKELKEKSYKVFPETRFIPNPERLPCDFTCTRRTAVRTIVDGAFYTMDCLDRNGNNMARCSTCCAMEALSMRLTTDRSSGMPSVDGKDCVCCFDNKC
uniref:Uncharacterized protein n=1 Tax=Haemonchus contortus TaxID=6289 RepID=A0A7I4YID8_HAECO